MQAQILALLDEQRRDRNMAVVLVTHDLGVVANHTDVIVVMYGGLIVERAPTRTLFSNMKMPYTEALFESIPSLEAPPHPRRPTIPGRPPDLVAPPPGCRFAPRCAYARDRCHAEQPPLVGGRGTRSPVRLLVSGRVARAPSAHQVVPRSDGARRKAG